MAHFGLIGKQLSHSFSKNYFTEKFQRENLPYTYQNFELSTVEEFPALLRHQQLRGLNVTIPYKTQVIPFLDELDGEAALIGAVNTINITNGKTKGFNTDVYGFEKSLRNFYQVDDAAKSALILGSGGASLAARFVLKKNGFSIKVVSRKNGDLRHEELSAEIVNTHLLIVNCTPVGTFPNVDDLPLPLPYELFSEKHFYFDMIYNPAKTRTANLLEERGVHLKNGLEMLIFQAEKSWKIWHS